jgi:hypothetical protein
VVSRLCPPVGAGSVQVNDAVVKRSQGNAEDGVASRRYAQPDGVQVEYTGAEGWVGLVERGPRADEGRVEVVEGRVGSEDERLSGEDERGTGEHERVRRAEGAVGLIEGRVGSIDARVGVDDEVPGAKRSR